MEPNRSGQAPQESADDLERQRNSENAYGLPNIPGSDVGDLDNNGIDRVVVPSAVEATGDRDPPAHELLHGAAQSQLPPRRIRGRKTVIGMSSPSSSYGPSPTTRPTEGKGKAKATESDTDTSSTDILPRTRSGRIDGRVRRSTTNPFDNIDLDLVDEGIRQRRWKDYSVDANLDYDLDEQAAEDLVTTTEIRLRDDEDLDSILMGMIEEEERIAKALEENVNKRKKGKGKKKGGQQKRQKNDDEEK
ncbi:hypothetical protein MMC29_003171 [Sticta canariensis]|nr:hypothetical protein [Sticta canariensis]